MNQTIFVVGMHRSGTSAIAGSLMHLGGSAPNQMLAATAFNPKGHFEPEQASVVNDAILASVGHVWHNSRSLPETVFTDAGRWVDDCVRVLSDGFPSSTLKIVKDPRISVLSPLWVEASRKIKSEPCFVIALRRPEDTADSLVRRDGFDVDSALMIWLRYTIDAERRTRGYRRAFQPIETFIENPIKELNRLGREINIDWPINPKTQANRLEYFIDRSLIRNGQRSFSLLFDLASKVYELMLTLHLDSSDKAATSSLDELRKTIDLLTSVVDERSVRVSHFIHLTEEVNALRRNPFAPLAERLSYIALKGLSYLTPILPTATSQRLERSAAKRDPDRPALAGKSHRLKVRAADQGLGRVEPKSAKITDNGSAKLV